MNKNIFAILFFILLCSFRGISQIYSPLKECGYEELMNIYKAHGGQFYSEKLIGNRDDETILKIPIVFHIVVPLTHSGDAYDYIAPNQIYDCLNILNMIFAGASSFDTVNINTNIKFYPATIDIYGDSLYVDYQCERYFGITYDFYNNLSEYEDININRNGHIVTYPYNWEEASSCDNDYNNVFPQDKYLNIWIFDEVGGYNGMGGSIDWDGHSCGFIALPRKAVGSNDYNYKRELGYGVAHEVGHYLGLSHPWPDYGVPFRPCDVSPHSESLTECYTIDIRHDNESISCNNIMEYTPDGCRNGFSQGQKEYMRAVITNRYPILTNCETYIYQGSTLDLYAEIATPVESIICNAATDIMVNLPDTSAFKRLEIYRDNTLVTTLHRQDTIRTTIASMSFNYPFNIEGNYELAVYCGRRDCEVQSCSRTIMAIECEALTSGLEKAQWYFDKKVSLDLSSGLAQLKYDSQMNAGSSESSICDSNGNLLFYTDGNKIWDSQHDLQNERLGETTNKGTIILKYTETKYAIVSLTTDRKLKGRIINIGNNNYTIDNLAIIYETDSLYGLTAFPTTDGNFWLISTQKVENALFPFILKVNGQLGVERTPNTIMSCPMSFTSNPQISIKVSPNANFICFCINDNTTQMFRFNAASGTIFPNNCSFAHDSKFPQVAFSPSGLYLYATEKDVTNKELTIKQYDLIDFNDCICNIPVKIIFSKSIADSLEYFYTDLFLQEGADGRIYFSRQSDNPYKSRMLGVILYPDAETNSYTIDNNCGVYDHFIEYSHDSEMKNDINLPNFVDGEIDTCRVDFSACADSCNVRTLHFINLSQGTVFTWTVKDTLGNILHSGNNIESILPSLYNLSAFIVTLTGSCGSKTDTIVFNQKFKINGDSVMCRDDRLYPYRILPDLPTQSITWNYTFGTDYGNNRSIYINSADVPTNQDFFNLKSIVKDRFACVDTAKLNIRLDSIRYNISTAGYCNEINPGSATFTLNSSNSAPYNLAIDNVQNITNSTELQHQFNDLLHGIYNYTLSNNVCSYSRHFSVDDVLSGFYCIIKPKCNIVNVNILNDSYQSLSDFTFDFIIGNTTFETISESNECTFEVNFYDNNANIYINPASVNQSIPISIRIIDSHTLCEHIIDTMINVVPHIRLPGFPTKPIYCDGDIGYTWINIYGLSDATMIGFDTGPYCNVQYVETEAEGVFTYQVNSTIGNPSIVVYDRNYDNCIIFKGEIPIPKLNFEAVDSIGIICEEGGSTDIYVNITIDPLYDILPDSVHWNTNIATYLEQTGFNTFRTVLPNVHAGTYEYTIPYTSDCIYENSITIEENPHITIVHIDTLYNESDGTWQICPVYSTRMYFGYTLEIYDSEEQLVFLRNNIFLGMLMCYGPFTNGIYTAKLIDPCGCFTTYQFVLERNELVLENSRLADVTCKADYNTSATFDIYGSQPPYTVQIVSSGTILASQTYNNAGSYTIVFSAPTYGGNIIIRATSADNLRDSATIALNMVCNQTALTTNNLQSTYNGQTIVVANNQYGLIFNQNVTFSNCTIYCAYDNYDNIAETQWTIPQGKYIYLVGTTIKSGCSDKMWQGITVIGDSTKTHAINNNRYHGRIITYNTTIEDAMCAVNSYNGGITTLESSNFNNNQYDIYIHPYRYSYTVGTLSLITGNTFSTTRIFNNSTIFPIAHINLENVMDVTINSNIFQNTLPYLYLYEANTSREFPNFPVINPMFLIYYTDNRGIGIQSTLSSFTTNTETEGINTFNGLYYGIYADGQKGTPISLYSNKMTNNFRSIYLAANTGTNVKRNRISVAEESFNFSNNNYIDPCNSGIPRATVPYGIYLNGCTSYSVQYDTITKGTTGMYIRNSGTEALQVSNCVFGESSTTGSTNAIIVSGTNSDYNPNNIGQTYNGLQIVCNDFTGNTNDIGVINGNMGSEQGFPNETNYLPAGNQFNINAPSAFEFRTQFQSYLFIGDYTYFDLGPYSYYQHDDDFGISNGFDRELESGRYTEVVLNGHGGVIPSTIFEYGYNASYCQSRNSTCTELLSEINDYSDTLEKFEADYSNRLDGGNTQSLLANIQSNSTSVNYDMDGFMSDECFYAILDEIENNPSYFISILIDNSPLPEHIYRIAMTKNIPEIYKNTLALYQSGDNSRVIVDREMSALRQSISYNESMLMNNALNNDSVPSERFMVMAYFSDKTDLQSKINVYRLNCASGNYTEALANLSSIESNTAVNNYEISKFCEVNRLYIGVITNSPNTFLDTTLLRNAVNEQNYLYSALAQVLYEYATDSITYHYTPTFIDEVQPRFMKADGDDEFPVFNVYPNPTNGIVNIELNVNMDEKIRSFCEKYGVSTIFDCEKISIEVYDVNSRLIMLEESNIQEPMQIDLSNYPPSNYTIRIKDCNDNLLLFKVVKI